jgi:hypothetical protein
MPTLTLSRALLRLSGVDYCNLGHVLTQDATRALRPFLEPYGFERRRYSHADGQGAVGALRRDGGNGAACDSVAQ